MADEQSEFKQDEIRFLGDMQRLELRPGDVLVLRLFENLSEVEFERLRARLENIFPGTRCVILERGMELGIVSSQDKG